MVRLKVGTTSLAFSSSARFDSILVRLKEVRYIVLCVNIYTFRFHTGSIKSVSYCLYLGFGILFRFHTGSIKSVFVAP